MPHLTKLTLKSVESINKTKDPVQERRKKLQHGLEEQIRVFNAKTDNLDYYSEKEKWKTNFEGERVLVKVRRIVKPWFFEQDGGWYVQCRYGARILNLDDKNNAVFVKKLSDVQQVLETFIGAAQEGEFDAVIAKLLEKPKAKAA